MINQTLNYGLLFISLLPVWFVLGPLVLPDTWLEPYAYWNIETLNRAPGQTGPVRQWRNQGFWRDTNEYPVAAEQLATRLLEFANTKPNGRVIDLAHGAGESLALHLAQKPPPSSLAALTSLKVETQMAQELVHSRFGDELPCPVEWYTQSASYHPASTTPENLAHPLNPMKGYMGEQDGSVDGDDNDEDEAQQTFSAATAGKAKGFVLIYVCDAIYHFPPHLPHFLTTAHAVLAPGGVIAFTDVLPPPDLPAMFGQVILPFMTGVPRRNFVERPKDLDEYKQQLLRIGYETVDIVDWTQDVYPGFAKFLKSRGAAWPIIGRWVEWAERNGWKYIAVRATKAG